MRGATSDGANRADVPLAVTLVDLLDDIDPVAPGPEIGDAVTRFTLQILGVARLGLLNEITRQGVDFVLRSERATLATVVAHGRCATGPGAAFANALAAHSDFREDTHAESQAHPGVVVIPAVVAAAEISAKRPARGAFAKAVLAGYELVGRIGRAAAIGTTERGFRSPSVYPALGAAVAAATVLGLSREQRVHALAIAAQGTGAINHPFAAGTDDWILAPAFAARQGLTSALLAAAGVEGSPRVLEGEDGVLAAFAGDSHISVNTAPVGRGPFEIERTRLKAALTCGFNQSLVEQLRGLSVPLARVQRIEIQLSPGAATYPGVDGEPPYASRTAALLSAGYATALQLVKGSLDPGDYVDLNRPELVRVARLVHVTPDPALEGYATRIAIHLEGGETLTSYDGNEHPKFSLDTTAKVASTLRRNFGTAGLDPAYVDRLLAGVRAAVERDDVAALASAVGA